MRNNCRKKTDLTTVDLFSGCGGLTLGFMKAGYNVVAGYDNWAPAVATYSSNFTHDVHLLDLSQIKQTIEHIQHYQPKILIGGPPCQDFSIAGKRKESQLANLTIAFAKIAVGIKPKIVVMENVYNIEKSRSLKEALEILKSNGYGITTRIIDASLTGVPQKRRRYFVIAAIDYGDNFFGKILDDGLANKPMTVFDHFGTSLNTDYYYAHPRNYNRRAVFGVHEPSVTIRRVNRPIPSNYKKHPADKAVISDNVRPLTTAERSQLQTFPKNFSFSGSASLQEHLIANAVPVKLAQYVAKQILKLYVNQK